MAGEIQFSFQPGRTCYVLIRNRTGAVWNGSSFVTYATVDYANYPVTVAEQGTLSAFYTGTFPSAITAGVYSIVGKSQLGGSPAESDPVVAAGDIQWNGTVTLPLSDLATSGQVSLIAPIKIYRGQMVQNFPIYFVSSLDHSTPFTSGIVSGQISRDGVSFGALQSGAFTEIGLGFYSLQALTSGDLLANTIAMRFSANGISGGAADPRNMVMVLQRASGSV